MSSTTPQTISSDQPEASSSNLPEAPGSSSQHQTNLPHRKSPIRQRRPLVSLSSNSRQQPSLPRHKSPIIRRRALNAASSSSSSQQQPSLPRHKSPVRPRRPPNTTVAGPSDPPQTPQPHHPPPGTPSTHPTTRPPRPQPRPRRILLAHLLIFLLSFPLTPLLTLLIRLHRWASGGEWFTMRVDVAGWLWAGYAGLTRALRTVRGWVSRWVGWMSGWAGWMDVWVPICLMAPGWAFHALLVCLLEGEAVGREDFLMCQANQAEEREMAAREARRRVLRLAREMSEDADSLDDLLGSEVKYDPWDDDWIMLDNELRRVYHQ